MSQKVTDVTAFKSGAHKVLTQITPMSRRVDKLTFLKIFFVSFDLI